MADIGLIIAQGWKNIWKQPGLLLYAALLSVGAAAFSLISALAGRAGPGAMLLALLLDLGALLVLVSSVVTGDVGRVFAAYSAASGERVSIAAVWAVVKRTWRKAFLLYCIYVACVLPFACVILALVARKPPLPARGQYLFWLLGVALGIVGPLTSFWLAGVVARGMAIRESFRKAWAAYSRHFWQLACTGLVLYAGWYLLFLGICVIALFTKSGFDAAVLPTINYLAPSSLLIGYVPYQLMSAAAGTLYYAVAAAVFMVAYVKYSQAAVGGGVSAGAGSSLPPPSDRGLGG